MTRKKKIISILTVIFFLAVLQPLLRLESPMPLLGSLFIAFLITLVTFWIIEFIYNVWCLIEEPLDALLFDVFEFFASLFGKKQEPPS